MIDYDKDTLNAYTSAKRAEEYKRFHTQEWSWGRFVTCFEQKKIKKILNDYKWTDNSQLLDIPCGTGILGGLLENYPFKITASDISEEMMSLAKEEYPAKNLVACTQADITKTKFNNDEFSVVICLGFLHRVPQDIKIAALDEIHRVVSDVAIVSSSITTPAQRIKQAILKIIKPNHIPAPCPMGKQEILEMCKKRGFKVKEVITVLPILSAHALFVLEK